MVVCTICNGRFFATQVAYEQHAKTSKAHFGYKCTICNVTFPSTFARSGHLMQNHQELLCRQCNRYYLSLDSLHQHYRTDPSHPSCPQCDTGFADRIALAAHLVNVHPEPAFPCDICDVSFHDQTELEEHWKESPEHPSCLICDVGFRAELIFTTHIRSMHPELWCGHCRIAFASSGQLLEHFLDAESSVHPTCTMCGEGFENQDILEEHMAMRHQPAPPTPPPPTPATIQDESSDIMCTKCDRTYRRTEDLLRHYQDSPAHPTCMTCFKGFLNDHAFSTHMAEEHPISYSRASTRYTDDTSVQSPPRTETVLSTPRDSLFPINADTDNTSHSQTSSRTQTALGYSRISTKDFESAPAGRRASSEPTPTLPVVDLSEPPETPQEPPSEDGEETDYERATESVYVTPSEEIVVSPIRSIRTVSYDSRPSTPERLPSPSSLVSPCSPRYDPDEHDSPTRFSPPLQSSSSSSISSPESPTYARTAQSFVTAMPPLRSTTSRQSTRSTTSTNVKAASTRSSPAPQPTVLPLSPHTLRPPSQASHRSLHARGTFWAGHFEYTSRPKESVHDALADGSRKSSRSRSNRTPSPRSQEGSDKSSSRTMNSNAAPRIPPPPSVSPARGEGRGDAPSKPAPPSVPPHALAWHCRHCGAEPHDPTTTMCGHLFCHGCIVKELAKNLQCPVCKKVMLVRLHVQC
ncbi:zinc finger protein [Phanerochaete sordida]|uniref:Zinc finger protein n=1 Tax=Phanerochaete sordida TaxID=48140 RepID=A0A9P3G2G7_9APHY|nr:zinc finger protein [Phanerochaete sordida]